MARADGVSAQGGRVWDDWGGGVMCATQQATLRPSQRRGGHMNTDTRHVLSHTREGTEGGGRRR